MFSHFRVGAPFLRIMVPPRTVVGFIYVLNVTLAAELGLRGGLFFLLKTVIKQQRSGVIRDVCLQRV